MSTKGRVGFYTIIPLGDLATTAKAIGVALGLDLLRDLSTSYKQAEIAKSAAIPINPISITPSVAAASYATGLGVNNIPNAVVSAR